MERASRPDCSGCYAPCCRSIVLEDLDGRPLRAREARSLHREAGADLRIISWDLERGRRIPVFACTALRGDALCGVYETRPEHCRSYDCREDGDRMSTDDWRDRPHCPWPREP